MKLFCYPNSHQTHKILITAAFVQRLVQPIHCEFEEAEKLPEALKNNPLWGIRSYDGKFPVLEITEEKESQFLWGANAIVRFLSKFGEPKLYHGYSAEQKALIDQWIDFSLSELEPAMTSFLWILKGFIPKDSKVEELARFDIDKVMKNLNHHLKDKTFLASGHITIADIVVFASLFELYTRVFGPKYRQQFPHVTRWINTLLHQKAFQQILPTYSFPEVEFEPSPPQGGDQNSKKKFGGLVSSEETVTVISFSSKSELQKWLGTDKFWLFGQTWSAKLHPKCEKSLVLNYYSEEKNFQKVYNDQLQGMFKDVPYKIVNQSAKLI